MTHKEMLKKMGLTADEHRDLMIKFAAFHNSLNPNQRKVMEQCMPTLEDAAKTFGPDVTTQQIESFMAASSGPGASCSIARSGPGK
jgi:hypothetical protein